jgi:aspartate aminotransferase
MRENPPDHMKGNSSLRPLPENVGVKYLMQVVSNRIKAAANSNERIHHFYFFSRYAERRAEPGICDFTFGNPHEMPLPGLVEAIRRLAIPLNKDWFAYKTSEAEPQAFLAERLTLEFSLPFEPEDIALTNGAFAAISVAFRLLLDVGDEAIFSTPAWFSYEPMLLTADVTPRKVPLLAESFNLDLDAIDAAITPRTRLVIINTPHNPRDAFTAAKRLLLSLKFLTTPPSGSGDASSCSPTSLTAASALMTAASSVPGGFIHGQL